MVATIFMHIPKTGGMTLRNAITIRYPIDRIMEFMNLPDFLSRINSVDSSKIDWFIGHSYFGVLEQYIKQPVQYICFLRNPVERVLSEYWYLKNQNWHPAYSLVANKSIYDFVIDPAATEYVCNQQTRYMTGPDSIETNIEIAKSNMISRFIHCGIIENWDNELIVMKDLFNWSDTVWNFENKNNNRPTENPPQYVVDAILDKNNLDIELYEFAKRNFPKHKLDTL